MKNSEELKNNNSKVSDLSEAEKIKTIFRMSSGLSVVLKEMNPNKEDELDLAKHLSDNLLNEIESLYMNKRLIPATLSIEK